MKHPILFFATLLLLASCHAEQPEGKARPENVDWTKAFTHRSLLMNFTSMTCGFCPRMNASVKLALEEVPGKFLVMCIHDSEKVTSDSRTLFRQYNILGMPMGVMDTRRLVESQQIEYTATRMADFIQETEENYPVSSAVSYQSAFSGNRLDLHLFLYLKAAADYKVSVFLMEDGIVGHQSDYIEESREDYVHDNVARISISDPLGEPFTTSQENSIKQFDYSVTVPSEYKKENLKILVIVQRNFGSQIVLSDGYGDYYVDNCAEGKAGASLSIQ